MRVDHAGDPRGGRRYPGGPDRLPRSTNRVPGVSGNQAEGEKLILSNHSDISFSVAVLDVIGYGRLSSKRATELCAAAFAHQGFDPENLGEVSVALVEPDVIRDLNLRFRERDELTDVLSFEVDGPYGEMVGEIVICPACIAPEMGVEGLVVHGALHLGGMDHGEDFEASEMARVQREVMEAVGGA